MQGLILWKNERINRLRRDMDRLLDRMWGEFGPTLMPGVTGRIPLFDLTETDKNLILTAEIPAVDPKALDIDILDTVLTIKGEIKKESLYRSFSRTIQLPCKTVVDDVKATFKKGILEITMPKCPPERTRKIRVKVS
jgi:HSP20 family protein